MLAKNLVALALLYGKPVTAISRILDRGRVWFAIVIAILVAILLHGADPGALSLAGTENLARNPAMRESMRRAAAQQNSPLLDKLVREADAEENRSKTARFVSAAANRFISYDPLSVFAAVVSIALILTPVIVAARALSGHGSFSVLIRQDYLSILMCALMAWAAAYLPLTFVMAFAYFATAGHASLHVLPLFIAACLYFLVLTALSVRTVFGTSFGPAAGLTLVGAVAAVAGTGLFGILGSSVFYLASPFLLYYAWTLLGSEVRSLGEGLRSRQHFQQQLEISTNNPRDADAHYQLGLIYRQRHQTTEAIARFERAVEIDPTEAEPHFQLGSIARRQSRFEDAIRHLTAALSLDEKVSQNEGWRELGAAYSESARYSDAAAALQHFVDRRPYDPEGLYWYGQTLARLDRIPEAREMFSRCIEAVKTMPAHRRSQVREWGSRAKSELRKL